MEHRYNVVARCYLNFYLKRALAEKRRARRTSDFPRKTDSGRVTEGQQARMRGLEMWCPARGCEFESRALRLYNP